MGFANFRIGLVQKCDLKTFTQGMRDGLTFFAVTAKENQYGA